MIDRDICYEFMKKLHEEKNDIMQIESMTFSFFLRTSLQSRPVSEMYEVDFLVQRSKDWGLSDYLMEFFPFFLTCSLPEDHLKFTFWKFAIFWNIFRIME